MSKLRLHVADKNHEKILLNYSRDEWNEWRKKNPHEQPNLALSVLTDKNFDGFDFRGAGFYKTNFTKSTFIGANFRQARLIESNFTDANISGCTIYGISAWDLILTNTIQNDLIITPPKEPVITVDDLQIAQFIYLLINNRNIREAIDAISNKAVLILGNFSPDRIKVLEYIKDQLRLKNYLPILFNFDKPLNKDLTETVLTLAGLSKMVIADLTEQRSIPHELASIRSASIRSTVIAPICHTSHHEYGMFTDFKLEINYLEIQKYNILTDLDGIINQIIIDTDKKREEIRDKRNS